MATRKASENLDAIELLIEDHKKVQKMFKDFEKLDEGDEEEKRALVTQCCTELKIHSQIEEEIFIRPHARQSAPTIYSTRRKSSTRASRI